MLGGLITAICFIGFMLFAFAIMSPGLFLYYVSIRMGFKKFQEEFHNSQDQFDENGMKIIDVETSDEQEKQNPNFLKKCATKARDFLNRFAE